MLAKQEVDTVSPVSFSVSQRKCHSRRKVAFASTIRAHVGMHWSIQFSYSQIGMLGAIHVEPMIFNASRDIDRDPVYSEGGIQCYKDPDEVPIVPSILTSSKTPSDRFLSYYSATASKMLQLPSFLAALALAVSSVEAGCYGSGANWSSWVGGERKDERAHVRNMCKGYTDGSGYHQGALQDVRAQLCR